MDKEIERRARQAIAEKVFPGCVVGIVRTDGQRAVLPFGHFTYETDSPAVTENTVYDMASVTKSIPLASLVLTFIAEKKLELRDPVTKFVPELHNNYGATIEDLLMYRVRGPRFSELRYPTFEEMRTHILEHGFSGPPGESVYTNLPAYLLGLVVERVGGAILPALADTYFFSPLDMSDTTFFPHDISRIPPTEVVEGEEIRGVVHDESARVFSRARRAVGHAGLFSSASDMLNFLEVFFYGDFAAVVHGAQKGLGWQLEQEWFMGSHLSKGTFGKTGFTGTSVVCDMHKGLAFVILSNRTYPTRPPDSASTGSAINVLRRDIADIVLR